MAFLFQRQSLEIGYSARRLQKLSTRRQIDHHLKLESAFWSFQSRRVMPPMPDIFLSLTLSNSRCSSWNTPWGKRALSVIASNLKCLSECSFQSVPNIYEKTLKEINVVSKIKNGEYYWKRSLITWMRSNRAQSTFKIDLINKKYILRNKRKQNVSF